MTDTMSSRTEREIRTTALTFSLQDADASTPVEAVLDRASAFAQFVSNGSTGAPTPPPEFPEPLTLTEDQGYLQGTLELCRDDYDYEQLVTLELTGSFVEDGRGWVSFNRAEIEQIHAYLTQALEATR